MVVKYFPHAPCLRQQRAEHEHEADATEPVAQIAHGSGRLEHPEEQTAVQHCRTEDDQLDEQERCRDDLWPITPRSEQCHERDTHENANPSHDYDALLGGGVVPFNALLTFVPSRYRVYHISRGGSYRQYDYIVIVLVKLNGGSEAGFNDLTKRIELQLPVECNLIDAIDHQAHCFGV